MGFFCRAAVIVVAALALSACFRGLNALAPSGTRTQTEGVAYGSLPRQKFDLYTPTAAKPAGGWPVVVFFYGGSWNYGERSEYEFIGEALASRGVLTLVADYRLYPEGRYPDFLVDSALVVTHAMERSAALGGNPKRVFVMGHSAGAYNAAMLALDPRWLQATGRSPSELAGWIGLAGAYDFYPIVYENVKPVFGHPDYPADSQPIDFVSSASPRAFLGAGQDDRMVDVQRNTVAMARRLQAVGVPVTLRLYKKTEHVMVVATLAWSLRWLGWTLDDIEAFVNEKAVAGS